MFGNRDLELLEERRQNLLLQSELHRRLLALDWTSTRASAWWLEAGVGWAQKLRPLLLVVAPLAGFWFVRKATGTQPKSPSRLWERVALGLTIYQRARSLWEQFRAKPPE
ncbi:hypothetical protein LBMAG56_38670 [Verrucomicrobiota bacterium]|nr:hypothetical protein LBMAG56_38670 [Verrucomicrobiota bacterium]